MTRSSKAARLMLLGTVGAVIMVATVGTVVMVFAAFPPPPTSLNPYSLPTDAQQTCVVTPTVFASWFQTGNVTLNGMVNPANSVTFPNVPNCSFYQWSKQMFLWLTSPAPSTYGAGGKRIYDSANFFDVSPLAPDGTRTFIPHAPGVIRTLISSAAQVGPQGLPLIFDRSGRLLQFKPAEQGEQPLVRDVSGQTVEIEHARLGTDGRPILLDQNSRAIQAQPSQGVKANDQSQISQMLTAQRFIVDGIRIFIDPSLAVIDVEQGQAQDNAVLEALPGGSLVYYLTTVNDVFAYFATGVKDGAVVLGTNSICSTLPNNCFPITAADLSAITTFAANAAPPHRKTFPDPNALAVVVKTAWVVAAGLPNLSSYITTTATIPTYDKTDDYWTFTGQQTVQLALVGMHVVGSANGHPEMIWATFEHFANAPRATYQYINTSGATVTVSQNTVADWLFCEVNSSGPFNQEHMSLDPLNLQNIQSFNGFPITHSDTIRWKAFGAASDVSPNPIDGSTAASNTEIISINNSISGMIASGDIRNNYVMTGATWTIGGAPPNNGNQVGTSVLANATIETYQQGVDPTLANGGTNCFSCHVTNTTAVSHDFGPLKPLF